MTQVQDAEADLPFELRQHLLQAYTSVILKVIEIQARQGTISEGSETLSLTYVGQSWFRALDGKWTRHK